MGKIPLIKKSLAKSNYNQSPSTKPKQDAQVSEFRRPRHLLRLRYSHLNHRQTARPQASSFECRFKITLLLLVLCCSKGLHLHLHGRFLCANCAGFEIHAPPGMRCRGSPRKRDQRRGCRCSHGRDGKTAAKEWAESML